MSAIKGDFIGFTFGGIHSSELGINRVSNGSRYTETLLPEFSNKTMSVPGANRVDYLGMEYTQKSFPLDIAFDSVTEEQLEKMRDLFGSEKPLPLVFDESPYKTYYAKAGGNPSLSYVCFDEGGKRIYKGEGKIDLVSFYPYAFTDRWFLVDLNNYLSDENDNKKYKYNNVDEWYKSSGLPTRCTTENEDYISFSYTTGLESIKEIQKNEIYNPGDFDTTFSFMTDIGNIPELIWIQKVDEKGEKKEISTIASLSFYSFSQMGEDTHIVFNGNNQLIEGYKKVGEKYIKTGNIYNQYIEKGNWFVFPKGMGVDEEKVWYYFKVKIRNVGEIGNKDTIVDYKILYL